MTFSTSLPFRHVSSKCHVHAQVSTALPDHNGKSQQSSVFFYAGSPEFLCLQRRSQGMDGKAKADADERSAAASDGEGEVKPSKGDEFPANPVSSNVLGTSKEEPEDPAKAQQKKDKVKSALIITGAVAAVIAAVVAVARNWRKT